MRDLKKNKQEFWYSLYEENVPIYKTDANGNILIDTASGFPIETGEYTEGYSQPIKAKENISSGRGNAEGDAFGVNVSYDRVISTTDMTIPITETTLIWIDRKPTYNANGEIDKESADYHVAAPPAKSLNSILIAVRRNQRTVQIHA